MAMVPQNVVLFHGSVADNIKYSKRRATQEDIIEAAKGAQLHNRILKLSHGYETPVGERGLRLSGGERQLLGLARAMLKKPKILFLDEPSAALDAKTEADWIEKTLMSSTSITRVVVTHRLASAQFADIIYVLDEGNIAQRGSHAQLLAQGGTYAKLWHSQTAIFIP